MPKLHYSMQLSECCPERGESAEMGFNRDRTPAPLSLQWAPGTGIPEQISDGTRIRGVEMPPIEGKFGAHPGCGSPAVLLRILPDLANSQEECRRWVTFDLGSRQISVRQVRLLGEYGCRWLK